MMKVETYACDQCKTQKKATNHWFRAYRVKDSTTENDQAGILILTWDAKSETVASGFNDIESANAHLCGANCVTEWLSKNLL